MKTTNEDLIKVMKKTLEWYESGLISIESLIDINSAIINLLINNK